MLKIKGEEYPVSLYEVYLHDVTADKLEWLRTYMKLKNHAEALTVVINHSYAVLKQHEEYLNQDKPDEQI